MTDYEPSFKAYERLAPLDPSARPVAVLVAGVPGAGKSTLAEGLARQLRAAVFSMDWQLGALTPFRVVTQENQTPLAEMMVVSALARQLQLGLDVVLDVTGHEVEARETVSAGGREPRGAIRRRGMPLAGGAPGAGLGEPGR